MSQSDLAIRGAHSPAARPGQVALPAIALAALLAAGPAALWTIALWDRTSLAGLSARWLATLLLGSALAICWLLRTARPPRAMGAAALLPAALCSAALVAGLYLSDDLHHAFVYQPVWRGLSLPASVALVLLAPVFAAGFDAARGARGQRTGAGLAAARSLLARHSTFVAGATLGTIGLLLALSYRAVATDDLIRYWMAADGLRSGAGYPASTGTAGSGSFYLVELPVYPLLTLLSFVVAGHRFLALQLPLIAANLALPFLLYALAREAGAGHLAALWLVLALLCSPLYQAYALGAPEPEPLLAAALAAVLWLAMRCTRATPPQAPPRPLRDWLLLGVASALAVLTRPEGLLYVGPLFLGLAWHLRRPLWRCFARSPLASSPAPSVPGFLLACITCALPLLAFAAFLWRRFGILWPAGWTNVAGAQFLPDNLRLVMRQDLPRYAVLLGLPAPTVAGPALALAGAAVAAAGLWRLCRAWPSLRLVPLALAANLGVILISPTYLSADLYSPPTFFRHLSVLFPWLVPTWALGLGLAGCGPRTDRAASPAAPAPARRPGILHRLLHETPWWVAAGLVTLATALPVAELAVLGDSAVRNQAGLPIVLTSDPYVLIQDLYRSRDTLPALPFAGDGGRSVHVDPSFDYLGFRGGLFAAVAPYDLHVNDAGRAYTLAAGVVAVLGLAALAAGATVRRSRASSGSGRRP